MEEQKNHGDIIMIKSFISIIKRDLKSDIRNRAQFIMIPLFFILAVTVYPLAIGPDTATLSLIAPGVLIIAALFSSLIALERLFDLDIKDGSFESLILCPTPFSVIIAGKILAHWLLTGLPIVIISPILAMMLGIGFELACYSIIIMALTTILLSLIGALISTLTINSKRGSVLLALLAMPLFIPVLIFGTGAIDLAAIGGFDNSIVPVLFLSALTVFALPIVPIICATIIKWQIE